ncbi:MAG: hypothetical protein A2V66_03270 [Ignavibacteria bacterium RBG_13_36_8]|nr:MAG: hypothetical protein A2V66_03270 [Ignavibacteria bacterium RBG_13_36_8]
MRYRIEELHVYSTPNAETIFQFEGLSDVTFEFPGLVNTILFIHCGLVRASLRGSDDYYEVVGRLYSTYHPNQNEEKHVGKLYVRIHGNSIPLRFETLVEKFEWFPDGSFDVITPDGKKNRVTSPKQHLQSNKN